MKKSFLYTLGVLLSAGAVLTACSSDDSEPEQTTTKIEADKTYYMTVNATKGGDTRALTEVYDAASGKTIIKAAWETDESIYVQYDGSWFTGTLHPQANNATAWLSGAITSGESIGLPATMTLQFPRKDTDYTEQDGTLEKISTHYDYATTTANVTTIEEQNLVASEFVDFASQQAIVKFTLQNENGAALNVSSLRVSATNLKKTDSQTGDITIVPSPATNELYAALRGINDAQVTLTATVNTGGTKTCYVYRKDNVTFANGKYRPITVKMRQLSNGQNLANIDPGYIGWVVGSDGKVYADKTDVPSGETAVAMVAYVYKDGSNVHGLAIALEDENTTMTQAAAATAASGHPSVTGTAWRLPDIADWKHMFIDCGNGANIEDSEVNYTCFNAKLVSAGGTAILAGTSYWSSSSENFNYLSFDGTRVNMANYDVNEGLSFYHVRVCLAF